MVQDGFAGRDHARLPRWAAKIERRGNGERKPQQGGMHNVAWPGLRPEGRNLRLIEVRGLLVLLCYKVGTTLKESRHPRAGMVIPCLHERQVGNFRRPAATTDELP